MQILDNYIQQVGFWLPRAQQQDIMAELSEEIRTQIDEKESALGRKLDEAEVATMLERWGNPLLVAERYVPQRHLIGPAIFPVYQFVLKSVFAWYLLPWMLVWVGFICFNPTFRAAHPGWAILGTLAPWWNQVVCTVGGLTILFATLDRRWARTRLLEDWKPDSAVRRPVGFEWKSKATVFGLPLVHIAIGRDRNGKLRVARGVVAIGQFGVGVITIAQFGFGFLGSIGQFVMAPAAVGQFAVGLIVIGQFAIGLAAAGQFAAHIWSIDAIRHGFPPTRSSVSGIPR